MTTGTSSARRHRDDPYHSSERRLSTTGERFPMVDSMRGIAAFSVVAYHLALAHPPAASIAPYFGHLSFGVTVFFVISGFLLYRPFLLANVGGQRVPLIHYGLRRVARIGPGYWVALTIVVLLGSGGAAVKMDPVAYYGFGQVYLDPGISGGIGQAWTLSVEVAYYLLLPVWAALMAFTWARRGVGWRWEVLGLLAFVTVGILWSVLFPPAGATPFDAARSEGFWLPRFLGQFAAGMGLATLSVYWSRARAAGRKSGRFSSQTGLVEGLRRHPFLAWLLVPPLYIAAVEIGTGLEQDLLDALGAFALLWPAVFAATGGGAAARLLSHPGLLFVGTVSYGVYLYHLALITRLDDWLTSTVGTSEVVVPLLVILTAAGSVSLGWLSWRFVELPAIRWSRSGSRSDRIRRPETT